MEKKQFKAESQRLMDLMINSIYTHKVPSFLCLWHAAFYVLYFTYRQIKENSLVYSKNYRYKSVTKTKHR